MPNIFNILDRSRDDSLKLIGDWMDNRSARQFAHGFQSDRDDQSDDARHRRVSPSDRIGIWEHHVRARWQPLVHRPLDTQVVLEDWSAQVDRALSRSADWGVPVNAIEFRLAGDRPGSPAGIYVTLAGTSVGRGWDAVVHAAGICGNRIRIEILGTP
jgi:hypothetical protein